MHGENQLEQLIPFTSFSEIFVGGDNHAWFDNCSAKINKILFISLWLSAVLCHGPWMGWFGFPRAASPAI